MSAMLSCDKSTHAAHPDAAFLMFPLLVALLIAPFGLAGSALAEPSKLTVEALRQAVSGRTVLIATATGAFPIRYQIRKVYVDICSVVATGRRARRTALARRPDIAAAD